MRTLFSISAAMMTVAFVASAAADAHAVPCACARNAAEATASHRASAPRTTYRATSGGCSAAELQAHYAYVTSALCESQQQAYDAAARVAAKWERQTVPVSIARDRYFDPVYAAYGPRAYAGSPSYAGPVYAASFERLAPAGAPSDSSRGYYRHAASAPAVGARNGTLLSAGATHSYLQSGMATSPGAAAPSAARVMNANR